jgi:glucose-1-phosphate cytidylyltransferase
MEVHNKRAEPWNVTLVDTGDASMTGGRLLRVADHLRDEDAFCMTYGDGVGDVDISRTIEFHRSHGRLATLTAAVPPGRFGALDMNGDQVQAFLEKPEGDGGTINAGFFVLSPQVFDYISDDTTVWEQEPLRNLASEGQLMAHQHRGFWQPMDTLRDKQQLEHHWEAGNAPWKVWS